MKSGQITDPDFLFNSLSLEIHHKYMEVGIELGLSHTVLHNELETGGMSMKTDSRKTMRMLHLWRDSVSEDDFTYSVLATALEKQGFLLCADKYCNDVPSAGNHMNLFGEVLCVCPNVYVIMSLIDYNLSKGDEVGRNCSTLSKLIIIIQKGSDYIYREYCA